MNASYILRLLKALLSTIRRNVFLFFVESNNNVTAWRLIMYLVRVCACVCVCVCVCVCNHTL